MLYTSFLKLSAILYTQIILMMHCQ